MLAAAGTCSVGVEIKGLVAHGPALNFEGALLAPFAGAVAYSWASFVWRERAVFKRLAVLALASIAAWLFVYLQNPPIMESVQAYPEYRCSGDWQPFDIAFSSDGTLYSTDVSQSSLFQHRPDCRQLVAPEVMDYFGRGIRGVAADGQGRVCFTRFMLSGLFTSFESYRPRLFCVAGRSEPEAASQWPGTDEARGMAAVDGQYLIALWYGSTGSIAVVHDGEVIRITQLEEWLPNFIYPVSEDEFFVTVLKVTRTNFDWSERFPAADGGSVLHVRRGTVTELIRGLSYPTGIAGSDDRLFVADYLGGVIRVFSLDGEFLGEVPGFEGPMGLALAPGGDICVAEMDAARVTCLPHGSFLTSQ